MSVSVVTNPAHSGTTISTCNHRSCFAWNTFFLCFQFLNNKVYIYPCSWLCECVCTHAGVCVYLCMCVCVCSALCLYGGFTVKHFVVCLTQDLMVDENIMKLEVKRLRDMLNDRSDEVMSQEKRKLQLETVSKKTVLWPYCNRPSCSCDLFVMSPAVSVT